MIFDLIRIFFNAIIALWNILATITLLIGALWISTEIGGWMGVLAFFGFLMIASNLLEILWVSLIPSRGEN